MNKAPIVDSFGRTHDYLRISLTDKCNLRCFYCMPEQMDWMKKSHLMTTEELVGIAKVFVAAGVKTIRLTGGEPLIHKDFSRIVRSLSDLGVELKLTTNGVLLNDFFDLFEDIGLSAINVSLDSLDQVQNAFITKRDYFSQIYSNIMEGISRGFLIKLNVVVVKGVNDHEIHDFIKLTKDRNLSVKFIEFMPFKGNRWDSEKAMTEHEILESVQQAFGAIRKLEDPKHSTSRNFQIAGYEGSFGIISTISNPFCNTCNRLRLTADGKLKNCLFANEETDLLTAWRGNEDIDEMIHQNINDKHKSRGGMQVGMEKEQYEKNRAMIAIGG